MLIREVIDHHLFTLGVQPRNIAQAGAVQTEFLNVCIAENYDEVFLHMPRLITARRRREPLLLITKATPIDRFGCDGDIDLLAMMEPIMKYNTVITHIDQLEIKLSGAVVNASAREPAPTHIMIPEDLLVTELANAKLWDIRKHLHRPQEHANPPTYSWK